MTQAAPAPATASPPSPALGTRHRALDGVRGLAALVVVIHHYCSYSIPVSDVTWVALIQRITSYGYYAVDLFFALSGFLITTLLLDAERKPNYLRTFYVRRLLRITPLVTAWVVLGMALGWWLHPEGKTPLGLVFAEDVPLWSHLFAIQNFFMATGDPTISHWLGVTWSVAVEIQFYMILPILIHLLNRRQLAIAAIICVVTAPIARGILYDVLNKNASYMLLPCRDDSLAMGVLIALAIRKSLWVDFMRKHIAKLPWLIAGCFVFWIALVSLHRPVIFWSVAFSTMALAMALTLLYTVLNPAPRYAQFLSSAPLQFAGQVSFGVYVVHHPVNWMMHILLLGRGPQLDLPGACVTVLSLLVTLVLAKLSWDYFESPIIRFSRAI